MHKQRQFSEHTMELIDEEVARILHTAADTAFEMLQARREHLESLATRLLEDEELDDRQIAELVGPSMQSTRKQESVDLAKESSLTGNHA
jgi:cell division protease FtsH